MPERVEPLVDAVEIARLLGKTRSWVYEHAGELGAVRLGSGPRPRLGFSPTRVAAHFEQANEPTSSTLPQSDEERERLKALVEGHDWAHIGHKTAEAAPAASEHDGS